MKTIITAVATAGLLSLAACGGGAEGENTATTNDTAVDTGLENEAGNIGDAANTQVNASTDTLGAQANALENGLSNSAGNAADATSNAIGNAANATTNTASNAANTAGNTL